MHEPITLGTVLVAVGVAAAFVALGSLLREPVRRNFMAVFAGGAAATYLDGGLGVAEFGFLALGSYVAYRGLTDYRWIGVAWLLHTAWDVVHHMAGLPLIDTDPLSSAGCAVTDALIAVWFFRGAPSLFRR